MNEPRSDEKHAILIVEDDPAIGDALRCCLVDEGHDATWVTTVADGREALRTGTFDVALFDLYLRGQAESIERLLEEMVKSTHSPFAVLMSASPEATIVARRFDIPLLPKPFDLDGLFAMLSQGRRPTEIVP